MIMGIVRNVDLLSAKFVEVGWVGEEGYLAPVGEFDLEDIYPGVEAASGPMGVVAPALDLTGVTANFATRQVSGVSGTVTKLQEIQNFWSKALDLHDKLITAGNTVQSVSGFTIVKE